MNASFPRSPDRSTNLRASIRTGAKSVMFVSEVALKPGHISPWIPSWPQGSLVHHEAVCLCVGLAQCWRSKKAGVSGGGYEESESERVCAQVCIVPFRARPYAHFQNYLVQKKSCPAASLCLPCLYDITTTHS